MAVARPTLYREVLTPALHRRFTNSALLVLVLCYVEAILIGEKSSFLWSWFPLGPTGFRALLLFISALAVFILRVGSLHLGARTSQSSAESLFSSCLQLNTLQTFGWYIFSAWWFGEVYIWSSSTSSQLGWIQQKKAWERDELNERPIYLRTVFLLFALSQGIAHLYADYDHLYLPLDFSDQVDIQSSPKGIPAWTSQKIKALGPIVSFRDTNYVDLFTNNVLVRTIVISLTSPVLYSLFFRRTAWSWALSVATLLWDLPAQRLSFFPPAYPSLVYRSITAGLQLILIWQAANAYFTIYTSRQPIKKSQPLSSESKDPTGTVLNGLRSRKEIPKTFATWELSLITADFPERRKAIFIDIDRPSGAAWTQVLTACLSNISGINIRINAFLSPPPPPSAPAAPTENLPRISTPLRNENIFTKSPAPSNQLERIESDIGNLAKFYGQSPTPGTLHLPSLSPQSKARLNSSTHNLLSSSPSGQKLLNAAPSADEITPSNFRKLVKDYTLRFLRSPLGPPFRQTFARRITSIVFGQPHSAVPAILCSIYSLSSLALHSLSEDSFGRVSQDVALLIRTYTETIQTIEAFVRNLPPHWTDVEYKEEDREVEEVEQVVLALKKGLGEMCEGFGEYAKGLGLRDEEMRVARKAAAVAGEAQEKRQTRVEMRQADQRGVWAIAST